MTLEKSDFGTTGEAQNVALYTLSSSNGAIVKLIDYGAIVVSVEVPDRDGKVANVNLGFDSLQGYLQGHPFFGATVGRYCNRIAAGKFTLDGETYTLATNNGPNHLHGGEKGFDKFIWTTELVENEEGQGVRFSRTSPDGEEGYPGTVEVTALYFLGNDNSLKVEFTATADKATPINLTNHCYWNLGGASSGSVYDHELTIAADQYLAVDDGSIPTEIVDVQGTPFDFTATKPIGKDIAATPGGKYNGYDHCFALRSQDGSLAFAARATHPASGRVLEIHTTQPGIQLYTGNFLDGSQGFARHGAFCLETQHYPDSPNQAEFPNSILRPGEKFKQTTLHKFLVDGK